MSPKPHKKIRVAIICGGISNERTVSLKSGEQVLKHLTGSETYEPSLIEIVSNGEWLNIHSGAVLTPGLSQTKQALLEFDVVFIALHGEFGEDGKIQSILETLNIPYTGSGVLASALCMNKAQTRKMVSTSGIPVPLGFLIYCSAAPSIEELDQEILQKTSYPCVIKPNQSGSSLGVTIVQSKTNLAQAISGISKEGSSMLVEEYIKGREFTCGVMGNSSVGSELQVLPIVEIQVTGEFFDYDSKYLSAKTREICPALLDELQTAEMQRLAKEAHAVLNCDGVSRSDFILRDKTFYFLETNTIPGLTEQSLCPKEAVALGWTFTQFLEKQLKLALEKRA